MINIFKKRCLRIKNELTNIINKIDINIEISIPIKPNIGIRIYSNSILIIDAIIDIFKTIFSLSIECNVVFNIDSI